MAPKKKSKRSHNAIRDFQKEADIKRVAARWEKDQPSYEELARRIVDLFWEHKVVMHMLSRRGKKAADGTNKKITANSQLAIQKFQELADRYWSKKPRASKKSVAQWIFKHTDRPKKTNGKGYTVEYIASCISRPNK